MSGSCGICIEDFNRTSHKSIPCNSCDFTACKTCVEHYISDNITTTHCMSCRADWNRAHVLKVFTKVYCDTTYKKHRENVLLDRERGLLPATQPAAERHMQVKNITKEIVKVEEEKNKIRMRPRPELPSEIIIDSHEARLFNLRVRYDVCGEITLKDNEIMFLQDKKALISGITSANAPVERREFIKACPANDCRGFLSSAWKCGLCEMWACPDCHEIKGADRDVDHICNPDVLATVRMLADDTRQCPKCPAMIFKIEGCDQMYCTQCHTAFSWRTGRVETGTIHNPHYYEFMRQRNGGVAPRNPGDIPCGGLIRDRTLTSALDHAHINETNEIYMSLVDYHRIYNHIQHVELQKYVIRRIVENEDLRIKFLVNEIDEAAFKLELQKREKAVEKKQEIHQILTMYQTVVMDLLNNTTTLVTLEQFEDLNTELDEIRKYMNTQFISVSKLYNCVVPNIIFEDVKVYRRQQRNYGGVTARDATAEFDMKRTLMYKTQKY